MKKILEVNFKYNVTKSELEKPFCRLPLDLVLVAMSRGFYGKIWLVNEAEKSSAGIYCLRDYAQ